MFSIFKKDPLKELTAKHRRLLEEAMHIQRSGDLRLYAEKMVVIEKIELQIEELQSRTR
jgi:Family of unknown function (DUF6435)